MDSLIGFIQKIIHFRIVYQYLSPISCINDHFRTIKIYFTSIWWNDLALGNYFHECLIELLKGCLEVCCLCKNDNHMPDLIEFTCFHFVATHSVTQKVITIRNTDCIHLQKLE